MDFTGIFHSFMLKQYSTHTNTPHHPNYSIFHLVQKKPLPIELVLFWFDPGRREQQEQDIFFTFIFVLSCTVLVIFFSISAYTNLRMIFSKIYFAMLEFWNNVRVCISGFTLQNNHITKPFLCPPWKRGHIVLQLSVGMSVCRSVDQVLSAQYLLILHLINTKLITGVALNEWMIPIDFQVRWSKVKVKSLFSAHCIFRSIFFDPFTWSIPNLVQGLPSMSRWSLLMIKGQGQITLLSPLCCPVNIFCPLHLINTKLSAGVVPNK